MVAHKHSTPFIAEMLLTLYPQLPSQYWTSKVVEASRYPVLNRAWLAYEVESQREYNGPDRGQAQRRTVQREPHKVAYLLVHPGHDPEWESKRDEGGDGSEEVLGRYEGTGHGREGRADGYDCAVDHGQKERTG